MKKRGHSSEVERSTFNRDVEGSIPSGRTNHARFLAQEGYGAEDIAYICGIPRDAAYEIVFGRRRK